MTAPEGGKWVKFLARARSAGAGAVKVASALRPAPAARRRCAVRPPARRRHRGERRSVMESAAAMTTPAVGARARRRCPGRAGGAEAGGGRWCGVRITGPAAPRLAQRASERARAPAAETAQDRPHRGGGCSAFGLGEEAGPEVAAAANPA